MVFNKLKEYGGLVMFSHTVFSLPFGLMAMIWAANGLPELRVFFWILIALIGARNGANAFNRIADRDIDKKNERTKERHLPAGKVKLSEAYGVMIFCFAILALAAYELNILCLILLPFAIALFIFYSYTKRITWLCHYILGAACGGAPVGAWIAVTGKITFPSLLLGAAVCMWVAGFDILYATQDIDFDRQEGLHSIPAKFGLNGARIIAALSHIAAVLLLLIFCFALKRGVFYILGLAVVSMLLFIEHKGVKPENRSRMNFIAYHINQLVSIIFFIFALTDFFVMGGRL
ncbi:MAG: 4-hydroxybenzoate octaprenyltransferase [Bacillota bacterium]|nr:4-hydroxybenzoate octaprenyltransferase [Bacillota bacterium]